MINQYLIDFAKNQTELSRQQHPSRQTMYEFAIEIEKLRNTLKEWVTIGQRASWVCSYHKFSNIETDLDNLIEKTNAILLDSQIEIGETK